MPATRNVAVLLFPDVELLDFGGPFEVFSVASRWADPPALNVYTVAERPGPVLAKNGLSVNPHHLLANCPAPNLLVIPGGQGTRKEMNNEALVGWIGRAAAKAEVVLSVCTGALLLAKAGLLDGLAATTHHGAIGAKRIGVTGRSGGGATSWWVAAADERVQCLVPVAGIADLWAHVVEGDTPRFRDGVVSGHCDCTYFSNTYRWDFTQVMALCAPQPLLLGNSDRDDIFPVAGYRRMADKVRLYVKDDDEAKAWEWPLQLQKALGQEYLQIRKVSE